MRTLLLAIEDSNSNINSQLGEFRLRRESLDTLHEVLVRRVVSCNDLSDNRDDLERVLAVDSEVSRTLKPSSLLQERVGHLAELEHTDTASGLEDTVSFGKDSRETGAVADTKGNSVKVNTVVLDM